jgi:hypothetical protein
MSLTLIKDIWKVLKPCIETGDTEGAAELLVNYLVEEDYSPAEIKQMFRGDSAIKEAVDYYLEKPEDGLYVEATDLDYEELDFDHDYDDDY